MLQTYLDVFQGGVCIQGSFTSLCALPVTIYRNSLLLEFLLGHTVTQGNGFHICDSCKVLLLGDVDYMFVVAEIYTRKGIFLCNCYSGY